jgi:hypothetical protein
MVFATLFIAGCSKNSSQPPAPATLPPKMAELGRVELTPQMPAQFALATNQCCILTGKQLPTGIEIIVAILTTNTDGTVTLSKGQIETLPGHSCGISTGDVGVELTPTLKTQ